MPGTCKTLTAVNQSLLTAKEVWFNLCSEYWELSAKTKEQLDSDPMLKKRFRIVKRGYEFWDKFDGIKCFASNIPIKENGKFGLMLTRGMLEQLEWLPPFTVAFADEIGSFCTLKESMINYKNYRMEDEARFSRHFEYWFIYTEQQPKNFNKSLRNVVGLNELMLGKKWIFKPRLLLFLKDKLFSYGFSHNVSDKYIRVYGRIKDLSERLGYFSINSKLLGNMELGGDILGKQNIKTFHTFDFTYDSKCFSSLYLCKDSEHAYNVWKSTSLPKNSPIAKSILGKYEEPTGR